MDACIIDKERFETFVGLGKSRKQVREFFCMSLCAWAEERYRAEGKGTPRGWNVPEGADPMEWAASPEGVRALDGMLDAWCRDEYGGMPFNTVYHLVQESTVAEFEDLMVALGVRGNPSAIAIANEVIRKKEQGGPVTINFVNALPPEAESDKEDD